ncbi:HAMP domain-containing sensor histidine kinase [Paenibacillus filicis]|uniref:histidine kinase n=1 Tax=Paenibacillus gyeongsangnamensis TaxID=3388067 RepID=A0ABT4QII6_9BACL|nr:HAMP domain-containing sensor histidine kinase [Paenibacillus filicis]MCZ8516516.1 HAMP domain-containing sensor histidine kinase [Paenibacillus filicis]
MSVRLRLTMWYTGILSATLLLLGLGLYLFTHFIYYESLKTDLKEQADLIDKWISPRPTVSLDGSMSFNFNIPGRDMLRSSNMFFQIVNLSNNTVQRSPNAKDADIQFPNLTQQKIQQILENDSAFDEVKIQNLNFMIYNKPIIIQELPSGNVKVLGMIQAGIFLEQYDRIFVLLRWILWISGALAVSLAASVGWFLSRKAFRPIEQVIFATNQIEKGADLDRRIEYYGPRDEIGQLTETINGMLGRLQDAYAEQEEAYGAQRRFVSDASHELRTPLTTIRGNVDLLEKMWKQTALQAGPEAKEAMHLELSLEAMRDIAGEAERMSRLVNDLLSLARADAGFKMEKTEVELRPLMEEVARKAQMLPRSTEWLTSDFAGLEGVKVYGNSDYLQQLLFIFIENAFKYTDSGYVRLDSFLHNGQVGIRIEDTGIGMDKEEIPHIFDRFYRADPSRGKKSGTGLGLSIAKWIIDEHNGSIEVKTIKDVGTTFVIWLPTAAMQNELPVTAEGHSLPDGNQV